MNKEIGQPSFNFDEDQRNREEKSVGIVEFSTAELESALHEPITKENLLQVISDKENGLPREGRGQLILLLNDAKGRRSFGYLGEIPNLEGLFPCALEESEQDLCRELLGENTAEVPVQKLSNVDTVGSKGSDDDEEEDEQYFVGRTPDGKPILSAENPYQRGRGYR